MKTITRLLTAGTAALLAMMFTGCEPENAESGTDNNAVFRLSIIETESHGATAAVISNAGSDQNTWLAFCTDDMTTPAADLLAFKIVELQTSGALGTSLQWGNKPVIFTDLVPKTDYRAIVSGVLADGTVYGAVSDVKFTTDRDRSVLEENTDWKPDYRGRFTDDQYLLQMYDVMVVDAGGSDEPYFTMINSKEDMDMYYSGDEGMKAFIEESIAYYQDEIDQATLMGYRASWEDVLVEGDTEDYYEILEPGDYYLIVIGTDYDGEATGYWAQSEFTIEEVNGSDEYNRYVGTWDCKGPDDTEATNTITVTPAYFDPETGSGAYLVDGWQTFYYEAQEPGEESEWVIFPTLTVFFDDMERTEGGIVRNGQMLFYGGSYDPAYYGGIAFYGTAGTPETEDSETSGDGDSFSVVGGYIAGSSVSPDDTIVISGLDVDNGEGETVHVENMEYILSDSYGLSLFEREHTKLPVTLTPAADNANAVLPAGKFHVRTPVKNPGRNLFVNTLASVSFKIER